MGDYGALQAKLLRTFWLSRLASPVKERKFTGAYGDAESRIPRVILLRGIIGNTEGEGPASSKSTIQSLKVNKNYFLMNAYGFVLSVSQTQNSPKGSKFTQVHSYTT